MTRTPLEFFRLAERADDLNQPVAADVFERMMRCATMTILVNCNGGPVLVSEEDIREYLRELGRADEAFTLEQFETLAEQYVCEKSLHSEFKPIKRE